MTYRGQWKKHKGNILCLYNFSLIELLIVVSVIAILASLLLPALSKARESAQGIKCLGNLKQIGCAVHVYAGDFNGHMAQWHGGLPDTYLDRDYWVPRLLPYVSDQILLWVCPSTRACGVSSKTVKSNISVHLGIGINAVNTGRNGTYHSFDYVAPRIDKIHSASTLIYAGDGVGTGGNYFSPKNINVMGYTTAAMFPASGAGWAPRHSGNVNFVFADGHAAKYRGTEVEYWTNNVWTNALKTRFFSIYP